MSEPVLIKIDHTNQIDYGFLERARWRVELDGCHIGDVWRGENGGDVKCWFGESIVLGMGTTLINSAVIGGYSRTTKRHMVQELVDWYRHRDKTLVTGDWTFHCCYEYQGYGDICRTYMALNQVSGKSKSVHATQHSEAKPHEGVVGGIGWHVKFRRGNHRFVASEYPDIESAIEVLLPELNIPTSLEEKKYSHQSHVTRFYYEENRQLTPLNF
jgi:hypothetical protein